MLKMAIAGIEGLGIETIELERRGVSYTYDTIEIVEGKKIQTQIIILSLVRIWWIIFQNGIRLMNSLLWFSLLVQRPRYKAGTS